MEHGQRLLGAQSQRATTRSTDATPRPVRVALQAQSRELDETNVTRPHNVGDAEFTDSADRELRQRAHAQGLTLFPRRWTVKVPCALTCAS